MKISRGALCLLLAALAAGLRAEDKPAGEPAKSGGWLVDAMNDQAAGSQDESKSSTAPGEAGPGTKFALPRTRPEDGVVNPLSSYLKTWITPRDLELLKIKGADADPLSGVAGAGRDAKTPGGLTLDVRANPYLSDLAPKVPAKAPQSAPAAPLPASAVSADKSDVAPAKTPGPPAGVLKSQDDAKYFPQLKHF